MHSVKSSDRVHFASGQSVRKLCREGAWSGPTTGFAPGFAQSNLVILPAEASAEFTRFCQRNQRACPLLAISEPGSVGMPGLGRDLDLRTDLPRYRIWNKGEVVDEPLDVSSYWRDDLVAFALGCSFSFEEALLEADVPIRNIAEGKNVSMYVTRVSCEPAGRFSGPLVVSMRPMSAEHAIRAVQITSRFPSVHGAPIHLGNPQLIGISDLDRPDFGDPVHVGELDLPVFWACGVTPQAALRNAKLDFAITHAPGAMLVTDIRNAQLAAF